ncbi:uncharacterized protein PWA37_004806 [Arxiozyma heterogenica]|uniref:Uncharacterized protein n=1 Tax=Arxiozyma heterogenica TaxID=278026 RepID=A0AAN7W511_9SACH|nr:hypothetical protein RI543_001210 [Kazachstania heterogenica]
MTETSTSGNLFLQKTHSLNDNKEYVSPFRNQSTVPGKAQLQLIKSTKFPNISATSNYNLKSLIPLNDNLKNKPRVKDLSFPQLLIDNEKRQLLQLDDLKEKEEKLKILKSSQILVDIEDKKVENKEEKKERENIQVDTRKDKTNRIAVDYDFVPPKSLEEEEKEKNEKETDPITDDYIMDAEELPKRSIANSDDFTDNVNLYTIDTELELELKENIEISELKDANDMILENKCKFNKPLDPALAPKVYLSTENGSTNKNTENTIVNGVGNNQLVIKNPKATPENPELIVKVPKYGVVSKAVYDWIQYKNLVNLNKINDLNDNYKIRSDLKRKLCQEKISKINKDKTNLLEKINDVKLRHLNDLETIENDKIFKLFQINAKNIESKYKIIHSTETLKLWKLSQLKFQRQKQVLLQQQLNELILESNNLSNEYERWNHDLIEKMEQLDGQLFKINQYKYKKDQLISKIGDLKNEQEKLQSEIDQNLEKDQMNKTNVKNITLGTHEYNNKLNELTKTISEKQNLLSVVKQEIANENLNLLKIVNDIEIEKQRREDEWNTKLQSTTTMFETKLKNKQDELDQMLNDLKNKHDEELKKLESVYQQELDATKLELEEKTKNHELNEQQIKSLSVQKLDLEKNIKELQEINTEKISKLTLTNNEITKKLDEQTKLAEALEKDREKIKIKMDYANQLLQEKLHKNHETTVSANNNILNTQNNSLYSFATEEEIVYK